MIPVRGSRDSRAAGKTYCHIHRDSHWDIYAQCLGQIDMPSPRLYILRMQPLVVVEMPPQGRFGVLG